MNDKDILQKFIFENAPVRGEIVHLDESYKTILDQHAYPPLIRQLLGEALAVVCLLTAILKGKGRLTIQFQGKGKLKLLLAQCDHDLNIRGIVQSEGELSRDELLDSLKQGVLAIMVDPDMPNATRYQGIVAWEGESLTQAIEGYFMQSEQLPTRLWLAVSDSHASGLFLQVLPKERPELSKDDWQHLTLLTETIQPEELLKLDNTTLLRRLYSQEEVRVFQPMSVHFRCTCSVKRCENAILILGQKEAEEELANKQKITVTCEFCNKEYDFDRIDVAAIFKKGGHSSTQVH